MKNNIFHTQICVCDPKLAGCEERGLVIIMKVGRYRELFDGIDSDKATDEKIKNKLLYYQGEEPILQNKKVRHETSFRRSKPFHFSFANISILRQAVPSLAFLLFVVAVIVGVRANLVRNDATSKTEPNSSEGTPLASQEDINKYANDLEDYLKNSDITLEDILEAYKSKAEASKAEPSDEGPSDAGPLETDASEEDVNENIIDATVPEPSDITEEITPKASEDIPSAKDEGSVEAEANDTAKAEESEQPAQDGDFYYAWFDVITENSVKASIPNLILRFHGTVDTIDPKEFSDVVLTRDGNRVDNGIYMTDQIIQRDWGYEPITDFYFAFDYENREPGVYGLTGKYQGVPFTVYNKILEAAITDEPADPADFTGTGFAGYTDKDDNFYTLTELCFYFEGLQNAFYPADLTDLVITCDGEEVAFSYRDDVFRYYEANNDNTADTSFNLILNEPLTQSGVYMMKCNYKGVPISSCIVSIP